MILLLALLSAENGLLAAVPYLSSPLGSPQPYLAGGQDQKPHFYALIFGTDKYDNWNALANPVLDARTIGHVLREAYGFEVHVFENQTYANIRQTLRNYRDMNYGPMDELFIFFAGHGDYDDYDGTGYLIAKDAEPPRAETRKNQIDFRLLATWVDQIKCNHILLVLDAAQGGTLFNRTRRGAEQGTETMEVAYAYKRLAAFRTRRVMTSGGKEYVEDGVPGHHSPFVRSLLEALSMFGPDRKILSLHEIWEEVIRGMSGVRAAPELGSFGTDDPGSNFYFFLSQPAEAPQKK